MSGRQTINIIDYGIDSGYGRVSLEYDNGKADEDVVQLTFESLAEALTWLLKETG